MSYEVAEAESNDQIVVTLHEEQGADMFIRSVDLFVSAMKVRFSARRLSSVEAVFQGDIAKVLREICETATLAKQIINVPDFCLRVRGLTISGYTLLVHTLENGMRQFIVRLKRATGNALALFRSSDDGSQGLSIFSTRLLDEHEHEVKSDRLFDEMLSHLYLPLVNLNNYLKNVLDGGERQAGQEQLAATVVQLKTKAEVLQFAFDRVISEMMLHKYTGPQAVRPIEESRRLAGS